MQLTNDIQRKCNINQAVIRTKLEIKSISARCKVKVIIQRNKTN